MKTINKDDITRNEFESYVLVQMSGQYNMIMNAQDAAEDAGLDMDTYYAIIKNYSYLKNKFKIMMHESTLDPSQVKKSNYDSNKARAILEKLEKLEEITTNKKLLSKLDNIKDDLIDLIDCIEDLEEDIYGYELDMTPEKLNEWKDLAIATLPNSIATSTAMKIEEIIENLEDYM